jgi:hypothetical protein
MSPPIQTDASNTTVAAPEISNLKFDALKAQVQVVGAPEFKVAAPVCSLILKDYERSHVTPHIGTEFAAKYACSSFITKPPPSIRSLSIINHISHFTTKFKTRHQLSQILTAPNSDDLIRELAILISRRGVVFFRNQDITVQQQLELVDRLASLTGRPKGHGLHIHPLLNSDQKTKLNDEVQVITSAFREIYFEADVARSELASEGWHSDVSKYFSCYI